MPWRSPKKASRLSKFSDYSGNNTTFPFNSTISERSEDDDQANSDEDPSEKGDEIYYGYKGMYMPWRTETQNVKTTARK